MKRALVLVLGSLVGLAALPARAEAFCGFYIDGAGKDMFNDATQVVLMRRGTRTVLSMQNTYRGPVEDFAMVVPVPVVLKEGDVKILEPEIFEKVDVMGSPRLVEYWEEDPCAYEEGGFGIGSAYGMGSGAGGFGYGVTVEEQFDVGEYQVVILSAKESTGLETWLKAEKYRIPDEAEALLRPYVEAGSKFFVARVDKDKVTFDKAGRAILSPLRFHYDSESFELPIRLGLANSSGKQDLIVNILSDRRYEVANYDNVTIPTNIDVSDDVRKRFGEFYAALFDRTLEKNPGAVVTEYAWDASSCDPCPGPTLQDDDFVTLGADVAGGGGSFVLTRLHARYGAKDMKDDLVFKEARPLVGGREVYGEDGKLEQRSRIDDDDVNNFQARYAIRHKWKGKIACKKPQRGVWGEEPHDDRAASETKTATKLAFVKRGKLKLASYVRQNIPEIGVKKGRKPKKAKPKPR